MHDETKTEAGPGMPAFAGRRVLLTGATRGIAAAIAMALGKAGASLLIHHSTQVDADLGYPEAAAGLSAHLRQEGVEVNLLDQDLSEPSAGAKVARSALDFGPVDSLVLSASMQVQKQLLFQTSQDVERQFRVNLHANIELLQGLLPSMVAQGFGRIVSLGSVQEVAPSADAPIYAMCKGALRNFLENLALQVGRNGITVNNIAPGLIETDRNAFRRKDMAAWAEISTRCSAMGRAGTAQDIVGPAMLCLSADASYMTGQTIYVSGGAHLPRLGSDGAYPRLTLPL